MAWRRLRTEQLIDKLVADLRPLHFERRIRTRRLWTAAIAAIVFLSMFLTKPLRADLSARLADETFTISIATSAMIFVTGVLALLNVRVSWRSRLWFLVPLIALGLWFASEFASIAFDVFREGWRAFAFESSSQCPLVIGVVGSPVFFALLGLSRIGLIVRREPIIAVAALSAFSLPATMLNLFHGLDTGAMVLLWHFSAVTVFSIAAASVLRWRLLYDWLAL
ncbi:MAG TPA: NrsF family protein [Kaistia sp.]|nr:NrsF family protein [Kaistia sp.]